MEVGIGGHRWATLTKLPFDIQQGSAAIFAVMQLRSLRLIGHDPFFILPRQGFGVATSNVVQKEHFLLDTNASGNSTLELPSSFQHLAVWLFHQTPDPG